MLAFLLALSLATPQAEVWSYRAPDAERVLSGRVVDPEGRAVPEAEAVLWTRGPTVSVERGRARSDAAGSFVLPFAPDLSHGFHLLDSFLVIHAEGFAPTHLERVYLPPPVLDLGPITVFPPVELRGRVTADGAPVAGAEVFAAPGTATGPHGDHITRPAIAVTDGAGAFACRVLPPGRVTLGVRAAGHADRVLEPIELAEDTPALEVALEPEHVTRLTVHDRGGRPLPEATVEFPGEGAKGPLAAFFRGPVPADARGHIEVRGLDRETGLDVRVVAPDHGPARVSLDAEDPLVVLDPVTWIEVAVERAGRGPAPVLHEVTVRDGSSLPSWCGNCDESNLVHLWKDSPGVQVLAPDRWRIAWNGADVRVRGGDPGEVSVVCTDGTRASVVEAFRDSNWTLRYRLALEEPARLTGIVRTIDGPAAGVPLGVQLSFSGDSLMARSGPDGRFEFSDLASGSKWLHALDEGWEILDDGDEVELVSGRTTDVVVRVRPRPERGVARGQVLVEGRVPTEPLLLALDEVPNQHLPRGYPRGFARTDAEGRFEIRAPWAREYHLVPKHTAPRSGWRDLAAEFPAHDARWPWNVRVPERGATETVIEFPAETAWDAVAPPGGR